MTAATATMTEEKMVTLVRNALVAAGHEMGKVGDHWPIIKATVDKILKDWENCKVESKITAEVQKTFAGAISDMEKDLAVCPPDLLPEARKIIDRMREIYDARFAPVDLTMFVVCDEDTPIHIRRAETIIKTLGDEHGD